MSDPALLEKVSDGSELGWVIDCLSAGQVLEGAGWLFLFYGYWSFIKAAKILLEAMLSLSFKWLLKNSL